MLKKILLFSFLLGLYSPNALSLETIYTGIQASQFTYEDDFIEGEPSALTLRLGGYLDEGTAIETRLGLGLQGYGDTVGTTEFEVEAFLGLYGLYYIGWGSNASVYGLLGLTNGQVKLTTLGVPTDNRETNVSYGVGLNFASFNVEIVRYFHHRLYDVTAISFGFVSGF